MSDKITPAHLQRSAYIYVRQSTLHQVQNRIESRDRQCGLAERTRTLGFASVHVIDDDLGRFGTGTIEQPSFARLLAAVCSGT